MTRLIILAAGQGARLRPLTDDRPKALVPIGGRPLIEWTLDHARALGIEQVTIVAGYLAHQFRSYEAELLVNERYATTNMVETLFCARHHFGEDCVISYGDILYNVEVLEQLLHGSAPVGVVTDCDWHDYWSQRFVDPLDDAETLKRDAAGRITEIGQKPRSLDDVAGQYIGLMRFQGPGIKALVDAYEQAQRDDRSRGTCFQCPRSLARLYLTDLIQGMIELDTPVQSVPINGDWLEIDTMTDYHLAQQCMVQGRIQRFTGTRRS